MSAIQTDFISRVLERGKIIQMMNVQHLNLKFLQEFSIPELTACCDRISALLPEADFTDEDIQRELIQNESFAAYLARLLPLIPAEEEEKKQLPPHQSPERKNVASPASISNRNRIMGRLCTLVKACQEQERDITAYPEQSMIEALSSDIQDTEMRLVFLEYFAPMRLDNTAKSTITASLNHCYEIPLTLNDVQTKLLLEPFVSSRRLFSSAPFHEICGLLNDCPDLLDIIRLLHGHQVNEYLEIEDYRLFSQNVLEYYRLLRSITDRVDTDAVEMFLSFWKKGDCALSELRNLERWITAHPGQDWDSLFATYAGYINLLYGVQFKKIDLSSVTSAQEEILIYAIIHNKKHFIRMVDTHTEIFFSIPQNSLLFRASLYKEYFNINELTAGDLKECTQMMLRRFSIEFLQPGRHYTFPELKALYNAPDSYLVFYHALASDSQDYRLKVLQQLRKRNLLPHSMRKQDIAALAKCLDYKPLYDWLHEDFNHVNDLTVHDAIQMLTHLEQLRHLIFSMEDRKDAVLALRNLDILEQFNSMEELKMNLIQMDQDWHSLAEAMGLNQEFLELHRKNILAFICENGANIAETYRNALDPARQEAFFRVVKAELMGQLAELKYFEGDLQREIDLPLTHQVQANWMRNLRREQDGLMVGEYDDFFSTMLLGVQPYSTCLAYDGGAYRECLLSSFDSNKKILYATLGGRIVGRAFLRLTKGRMTDSDEAKSRFTFVDLEHVKSSRQGPVSSGESLTLFLERPYTRHVNSETESQVMQSFVALAQKKAEELGAVLVLSVDYRGNCGTTFAQTHFDIYISKSKAGIQYLDSLDGPAAATKEGSYKASTFLVQKDIQ